MIVIQGGPLQPIGTTGENHALVSETNIQTTPLKLYNVVIAVGQLRET